MIVQELQNDADWENFSGPPGRGSLYHALVWRRVIREAFGHRPHYLVARNGSGVRGLLPLVEMKSALFGHFLVSLPFLNYGGIVADGAEAEAELARGAVDVARECGASHIELRQASPMQEGIEGWTLRQHKAALVIKLASDSKAHWDGISSRLRGKVRKAEKNEATFAVSGAESLDAFYGLYALNMRDLGTPVYARAFFERVVSTMGDCARILLVRRAGHPAAAAIALRHGNTIELPWICQDYRESAFNVNEFLYWKAIEWACASGASELDLGRSSIDAGTYRFKVQWNPEIRPLYWYYWTAPGVPLPQLNPDNPKFALAVRCWKKLPLGVANRVGPWIVRNIP